MDCKKTALCRRGEYSPVGGISPSRASPRGASVSEKAGRPGLHVAYRVHAYLSGAKLAECTGPSGRSAHPESAPHRKGAVDENQQYTPHD